MRSIGSLSSGQSEVDKNCAGTFSLTYSYRVALILLVSGKEITLLDIGSHNEVYR